MQDRVQCKIVPAQLQVQHIQQFNSKDSSTRNSASSTDSNSSGQIIQSWRPGPERSKVFSGMKVLITRQLDFMKPANTNESLKSVMSERLQLVKNKLKNVEII